MPIDPDETPPEGLPEEAIPDEPPTRPDLSLLDCPECRGQGRFFVAATLPRLGDVVTCPECKGAKLVSREQFTAWRARRQGRSIR